MVVQVERIQDGDNFQGWRVGDTNGNQKSNTAGKLESRPDDGKRVRFVAASKQDSEVRYCFYILYCLGRKGSVL